VNNGHFHLIQWGHFSGGEAFSLDTPYGGGILNRLTDLQSTLGHDDQVAVDDHSHPHAQQLPDRLEQHVFTEPQEDEARQDVAHAEQTDPCRPGY